MYLNARLTVDPSAVTQLVKTKPTRGFGRLAGALSGGLKSSQEEQETFSALTIIQQLFMVLRSLGINDIVRISKDQEVLFDDVTGKPDDLKPALEQTIKKLGKQRLQVFESLTLVLLHNTQDQTCLLQLQVRRTHAVGEHPLQLVVNAFPREFSAKEGEQSVSLKLSEVFRDQSRYDDFLARQRKGLATFLEQVRKAFQARMQVDAVEVSTSVKIVRPQNRISEIGQLPLASHNPQADPAFSGCFGTEAAFFYAWLWADLCHQQNIRCSNCLVVDGDGELLETLDARGVDAQSHRLFNLNADLTPPATGSSGGTAAGIAAASMGAGAIPAAKQTGEGESWLQALGRLLLPEPGTPEPDADIDFNNIEYAPINPNRLEIKPFREYSAPLGDCNSSGYGGCGGCSGCSGCSS